MEHILSKLLTYQTLMNESTSALMRGYYQDKINSLIELIKRWNNE